MEAIKFSSYMQPGILNDYCENPKKLTKVASFQDKSFKILRVSGRFLYSLIASIFYNSIAACSWILRLKNVNHDYNALATYHFERAITSVFSYGIFGSNLINFGVNNSGPIKEPHLLDDKPLEKLKALYGNDFEVWYKKSSSGNLPIDEKKLHVVREGICYGISIDYISRYLKAMKASNEDPKDIIKAVSQHYVEHGTKEAQMTQILFEAQDYKNYKAVMKVDEDPAFFTPNMSSEELKAAFKAKEEYDKAKYTEDYFIKKKLAYFKFLMDKLEARYKNTAQNLGLDIAYIETISKKKENKNEKLTDKLNDFLKSLEPGAYLLGTHSEGNYRHATAYIKVSDDVNFFHDPNLGSSQLSLEEASVKMLKPLEMFEFNEKEKNLYFFRCQLNIGKVAVPVYNFPPISSCL